MGKTMTEKCPKCNKATWIRSNKLSGLISVEKKDFSKYKAHLNNFILVRAYLCTSCDYIELYMEKP